LTAYSIRLFLKRLFLLLHVSFLQISALLLISAFNCQVEQLLISSLVVGGGFDAQALAEATGGHPLSAMGYWALSTSGVMAELGLSASRIIRCATVPKRDYYYYFYYYYFYCYCYY
jgi:hypothetical protein